MMREKQIRYHQPLSNGQILSVYFVKDGKLARAGFDGNDHYFDTWRMGAVIGPSRRENNDWWSGKGRSANNPSTGRCGLEGLLAAKAVIFEKFLPRVGGYYRQKLVVTGADSRRLSAYRHLLRAGFLPYNLSSGEEGYVLEF